MIFLMDENLKQLLNMPENTLKLLKKFAGNMKGPIGSGKKVRRTRMQ